MKKVLLGLTTTSGSDWREKIKEINELGLKEVALFPTCLKYNERQELYSLLEKTSLKSIPHVHLRDDMAKEEVDYLAQRYQTKLFNLHPNRECFAYIARLKNYKEQIFLENLGNKSILQIKENTGKVAGLCLDFSHWESGILNKKPNYSTFAEFVLKQKIGCCHVSAIYEKPKEFDSGDGLKPHYSCHKMEKLENLYYIKKYLDFLPEIISIELENSFKEQLEAKKYLEKLING